MATSRMSDSRYDRRAARLARIGVVGILFSHAVLSLDGVLYIVMPRSRAYGGGLILLALVVGIPAVVALRRTWSRVDPRVTTPTPRERLRCAADVAGMSPQRVVLLERSLIALWTVLSVVALVIIARGT